MMKDKIGKPKKWCLGFIIVLLITMVLIALLMYIIDPFLHYRKPIEGYAYDLGIDANINQRYINDGMVKHMDYSALITGSSHSINFRCSEAETLFGETFIRASQKGGTLKEIDQIIRAAFKSDNDIKLVIRPLEESCIASDKDSMYLSESEMPTYLYDDNMWNDVSYLLGINSFLRLSASVKDTLLNHIKGKEPKSFDDFWMESGDIAWDRENDEIHEVPKAFDQSDEMMVHDNIEQNVLETVRKYPDTEFYYYIVPYSVAILDSRRYEGTLEYLFKAQEYAVRQMLDANLDNLHVFSFYNVSGLCDNLDNFSDTYHYNSEINSQILIWINNGEYEVTLDNFEDYCDKLENTWYNFDYDTAYSKFKTERTIR